MRIDGLRIFACHGVLPQEHAVGANYVINISIETDFSRALEKDELDATISYAEVCDTVKVEMAKPSKLLEHVGGRICNALFQRFPAAKAIHLELFKENPPMAAQCTGAGITIDALSTT